MASSSLLSGSPFTPALSQSAGAAAGMARPAGAGGAPGFGLSPASQSSAAAAASLLSASPSGLPHGAAASVANGSLTSSRAVLTALRALQDKIRRLEAERGAALDEAARVRLQATEADANARRLREADAIAQQEALQECKLQCDRLLFEKNELQARVGRCDAQCKDMKHETEELRESTRQAELERQAAFSKVAYLEERQRTLQAEATQAQDREITLRAAMVKEAQRHADTVAALRREITMTQKDLQDQMAERAHVEKQKREMEDFVTNLLQVNESLVDKLARESELLQQQQQQNQIQTIQQFQQHLQQAKKSMNKSHRGGSGGGRNAGGGGGGSSTGARRKRVRAAQFFDTAAAALESIRAYQHTTSSKMKTHGKSGTGGTASNRQPESPSTRAETRVAFGRGDTQHSPVRLGKEESALTGNTQHIFDVLADLSETILRSKNDDRYEVLHGVYSALAKTLSPPRQRRGRSKQRSRSLSRRGRSRSQRSTSNRRGSKAGEFADSDRTGEEDEDTGTQSDDEGSASPRRGGRRSRSLSPPAARRGRSPPHRGRHSESSSRRRPYTLARRGSDDDIDDNHAHIKHGRDDFDLDGVAGTSSYYGNLRPHALPRDGAGGDHPLSSPAAAWRSMNAGISPAQQQQQQQQHQQQYSRVESSNPSTMSLTALNDMIRVVEAQLDELQARYVHMLSTVGHNESDTAHLVEVIQRLQEKQNELTSLNLERQTRHLSPRHDLNTADARVGDSGARVRDSSINGVSHLG